MKDIIRLFRQTHKTFQIHHLALLMFKDYIMILVGTLQRIHRQYVRYESALDDTFHPVNNTHVIPLREENMSPYFQSFTDIYK